MSLSTDAYQDLQAFAKKIQKWLSYCSSEILKANPDLVARKAILEKNLYYVTKLLEKQSLPTQKGGVFYLQWDEGEVDPLATPLLLKCWGAFPEKGFDKTNVEATATFYFGGQQVAGIAAIANSWNNNGYECIRYNCSATPPNDFLSGTIQVTVRLKYKGQEDTIDKSLDVPGISELGQAVLDFLDTITLEEEQRTEAWNYATGKDGAIVAAQTMDQLRPLQYKLQTLLAFTQELHQAYHGFTDTAVLKQFIYPVTFDQAAKEQFGGHWQVALAEGSSLREKAKLLV